MADTMSRLTLPTSTMRAMSSVSASVTRRPSRNSGSLPSRAMSSPICGPPPWTTTGRMPTARMQHDVRGERLGERGVDHGVAAVLHDDGRPRKRRMYGSASTRTSAVGAASSTADAHDVPMFSSM